MKVFRRDLNLRSRGFRVVLKKSKQIFGWRKFWAFRKAFSEVDTLSDDGGYRRSTVADCGQRSGQSPFFGKV